MAVIQRRKKNQNYKIVCMKNTPESEQYAEKYWYDLIKPSVTNISKNFPYRILDLRVVLKSCALWILPLSWFKNKITTFRGHIAPWLWDKNYKETCSVRPNEQRRSQAIWRNLRIWSDGDNIVLEYV